MWRSAEVPCALRGRPAWVACLAMACAAAPVQAEGSFQCAPLVASTSRQPAYGPAPGAARCEGFYEKNVSQPFLELVSLTRSAPGTFAADAHGILNLRGLPQLDMRLVIQPMRSNPLYRVDAALARGATLQWASGTMLQATGLLLRDLGFLAQAGPGRDPPAFAPVGVQPGDEGARAYAVLRPSVGVSSIAWRGYRSGGNAPTWQTLTGAPLFAWERIVLPIPLPADGHGLRIDVRAVDSQGLDLPLLQFAVLGVRDEAP
jgi:hypothetical protein